MSILVTEFLAFKHQVQWTLEIVDLDIVDSLVSVNKIAPTNYELMK